MATSFMFQCGRYADDPVALLTLDMSYTNPFPLPGDFGPDNNTLRHGVEFAEGDGTENYPAYYIDSDLIGKLIKFANENGLIVINREEMMSHYAREVSERLSGLF